mmetsp:Transcript_14663/g.28891  ORF Transcript_14663/g.28891 Transcript_14663/m.28891 type:complete len:283 (+) Transcript_14663:33-881(+)
MMIRMFVGWAGICVLLIASCNPCRVVAEELTTESWARETAFKTVFVNFYKSSCKHCKAIRSQWNKLMKAYATSDSVGIFEVDCSDSDSVELCQQARVEGVPDLRFGDPTDIRNLQSYSVFDTEYAQLEEFVNKTIVPQCSPRHLEICNEAEKSMINGFYAKGTVALNEHVALFERQLTEKWDKLDKKKLDRKKRENDFRARNTEFKKKTEFPESITPELDKEKEQLDREKESLMKELENFDIEAADISKDKKDQGLTLMKLVLLDLAEKSKKKARKTKKGEL